MLGLEWSGVDWAGLDRAGLHYTTLHFTSTTLRCWHNDKMLRLQSTRVDVLFVPRIDRQAQLNPSVV